MVLISKHDKRVWENYISNFEKFVVYPHKEINNNSTKKLQNAKTYKKNTSKKYSKLFKKNRIKPDAVLDLHGHSLYSGRLVLQKYVFDCYEKSIRNILIITGKGQNNKGAFKEEVPKWLKENFFNKLLVDFKIAPKHFGGEGALLVRIKNRFK